MTPVSGSISTSAIWQPFGKVAPKEPSARQSIGCGDGPASFLARSKKPIDLLPALNCPPLYSTPAPSSAAASGETSPVGEQQGLVHHFFELAAVVSRPVGGPVGHRLRWDEILPPQRDRVEAVLGRRAIDEALDHAGDVGPPGAAVRRDRNG